MSTPAVKEVWRLRRSARVTDTTPVLSTLSVRTVGESPASPFTVLDDGESVHTPTCKCGYHVCSKAGPCAPQEITTSRRAFIVPAGWHRAPYRMEYICDGCMYSVADVLLAMSQDPAQVLIAHTTFCGSGSVAVDTVCREKAKAKARTPTWADVERAVYRALDEGLDEDVTMFVSRFDFVALRKDRKGMLRVDYCASDRGDAIRYHYAGGFVTLRPSQHELAGVYCIFTAGGDRLVREGMLCDGRPEEVDDGA